MQITNEFALELPPDRAYRLLLDLEQVTPCLPGAELGEEKEDGARAVKVTVKLGPMRFVYDGTVRIAEADDAAQRAVLVGEAREARGQGSAQATIAMTVSAADAGSRVEAVADVELTGRAAQMGRGVVEDVAKRMIADMATCLESRFGSLAAPEAVAGGAHAGTTPPTAGATPQAATAAAPKELSAISLAWTVLTGRIKALFGRT